MALKNVFKTMKKKPGSLGKKLDQFLITKAREATDRAIDVNSPSTAGNCMRANFYNRLGFAKDGDIDPRGQRIFHTGDYMHERFQKYFEDMGVLLMREVPLRNDEYIIQGHTDGYVTNDKIEDYKDIQLDLRAVMGLLDLDPSKVRKEAIESSYKEVEVLEDDTSHTLNIKIPVSSSISILELKSINNRGFSQLKAPKEAHKIQAMTYLYCAEERRKVLRENGENYFMENIVDFIRYYASLYTHLVDGRKYSRDEKLLFKVIQHIISDYILVNCVGSISTVTFLYEDKDNQEVKVYEVNLDNDILEPVLSDFNILNNLVVQAKGDMENVEKYLPERGGKSKSQPPCRWCNHSIECFN